MIAACEVRLLHLIVRQLCGVTWAAQGGARVAQRMGIDAAVEHLHAHFADSHTVRELARVAALSPSHFAHEFKREMGLSPMDYLHRLRLDYARQQLLRSDATLTEIAMASGFGSSSYFSTSFARRFGLPPSEYRKSYGGAAR